MRLWRRSRVPHDDVDEARGHGGVGVLEGGLHEGLGGRADGRDRRAELVRDVGHEVAPQRLEPAQVGHVDEHREQPARLSREARRVDEQASRLDAGQVDLPERHGASGARAVDQLVQVGVTDDLDEELVLRVRPEEQHRPQRRVHHDDAAVLVEDEDPLLHALEDATLQIALAPELAQVPFEAPRELVERVP